MRNLKPKRIRRARCPHRAACRGELCSPARTSNARPYDRILDFRTAYRGGDILLKQGDMFSLKTRACLTKTGRKGGNILGQGAI